MRDLLLKYSHLCQATADRMLRKDVNLFICIKVLNGWLLVWRVVLLCHAWVGLFAKTAKCERGCFREYPREYSVKTRTGYSRGYSQHHEVYTHQVKWIPLNHNVKHSSLRPYGKFDENLWWTEKLLKQFTDFLGPSGCTMYHTEMSASFSSRKLKQLEPIFAIVGTWYPDISNF